MKKLVGLLIGIILSLNVLFAQVFVPDHIADSIARDLLRKDYLERELVAANYVIKFYTRRDSLQTNEIMLLKKVDEENTAIIYTLKEQKALSTAEIERLYAACKKNRIKGRLEGGIAGIVLAFLIWLIASLAT